MIRRSIYPAIALVVLAAATVTGVILLSTTDSLPTIEEYSSMERPPSISPDYADIVIPPNIAPLNFVVKEAGQGYRVEISGESGEPIHIQSRNGDIVIPLGGWKKLLLANTGKAIHFDVYVWDSDRWRRYKRITNQVADEKIDGYLVYREMPVYNLEWKDMGIYQRCLHNFETKTVLHKRQMTDGCVNCHTFLNNSPADMFIHFRSKTYGKGSVVHRNGEIIKLDSQTPFSSAPAIYTQWHPSGDALAFSVNSVAQFFHTTGNNRDVVDLYSDIAVYLFETNTVTTIPELSRSDTLETYPTWSPDGKYIYYCSAPKLPITRHKQIRYDIKRIAYDIETDTWGKIETVISAAKVNMSVTLPRFSPDGKFLAVCMTPHGNFPAFSKDSDIYLVEVATGRISDLAANSDQSDAYHSWSSDGRWMVFSSKRRDGLMARPYFCYIDQAGVASKAFILPQEDPRFYDSHIRAYNLPELIKDPVPMSQRDLARVIRGDKVTKAKLDPRVKPRTSQGPAVMYKPGPGG